MCMCVFVFVGGLVVAVVAVALVVQRENMGQVLSFHSLSSSLALQERA